MGFPEWKSTPQPLAFARYSCERCEGRTFEIVAYALEAVEVLDYNLEVYRARHTEAHKLVDAGDARTLAQALDSIQQAVLKASRTSRDRKSE